MYIAVLITTSSRKEARNIAEGLVKSKLAACVNIIDKIESIFWWQGKLDCAKELLLVAKTKKTNFKKIVKAVKAMHSYQVPEIIALPITSGNKAYLGWINDSIR